MQNAKLKMQNRGTRVDCPICPLRFLKGPQAHSPVRASFDSPAEPWLFPHQSFRSPERASSSKVQWKKLFESGPRQEKTRCLAPFREHASVPETFRTAGYFWPVQGSQATVCFDESSSERVAASWYEIRQLSAVFSQAASSCERSLMAPAGTSANSEFTRSKTARSCSLKSILISSACGPGASSPELPFEYRCSRTVTILRFKKLPQRK